MLRSDGREILSPDTNSAVHELNVRARNSSIILCGRCLIDGARAFRLLLDDADATHPVPAQHAL
jgi:hypothetical protein